MLSANVTRHSRSAPRLSGSAAYCRSCLAARMAVAYAPVVERVRAAARLVVPWAILLGYGGLFLGGVFRLVGEVLARSVWPAELGEATPALVITAVVVVLAWPLWVRAWNFGRREGLAYHRAFGNPVPRWSPDVTRRTIGLLAGALVAGLAVAAVLPGPEAAALAIGSSIALRLASGTLVGVLGLSKAASSVVSSKTD